jgi:bifunctional non-homologous end joining protein LigD
MAGWLSRPRAARYSLWRIVAYKDGSGVRLISRNGRDHTARFPDIADAVAKLSARVLILDGEVCAFDTNLISHMYLLDGHGDEPATPPVFMAFDCMF